VSDNDKLMYDMITDVVGGQSGSAIWDANRYIRGISVHMWACPSTCYQADVTTRCCGNSNGHVQVDAEHYNEQHPGLAVEGHACVCVFIAVMAACGCTERAEQPARDIHSLLA
jgi:hypothetical protein